MNRKTAPAKRRVDAIKPAVPEAAFDEVVEMIEQSRHRATQVVNSFLVDLYWQIGEHLSRKIEADGWGKRTVVELSAHVQRRQPGIRGFSPQNLWRMRQFVDAWRDRPQLSALLRELPWTQHLIILGQSKRPGEQEFYLRRCLEERWSSRELERQFRRSLFERTMLSPPKLSPPAQQTHPAAASAFKDSYVIEFLSLPDGHSEADLHRGLLSRLKEFLIELGRDFCFVGSEHPIQVGGRDFELDLLFFHRGLNCLVAIELKVGRFEPEYLGKLEFYLEALDRDHRKSHENPAMGVLLCASKDREVVEYALSRSLSPALIAEYQTQLPDKKMLAAKLHEMYVLNAPEQARSEATNRFPRKPR